MRKNFRQVRSLLPSQRFVSSIESPSRKTGASTYCQERPARGRQLSGSKSKESSRGSPRTMQESVKSGSSGVWRLLVGFLQRAESNPIGSTNCHQSKSTVSRSGSGCARRVSRQIRRELADDKFLKKVCARGRPNPDQCVFKR